jgi:predicted MFS family arabinose efflux permease
VAAVAREDYKPLMHLAHIPLLTGCFIVRLADKFLILLVFRILRQ